RADARLGYRSDRVGARDGAILGVLVVVEEHAMAFLLPPLARGDLGRAPLDLARQRQSRAPHLHISPPTLDPRVDVDAARARGFGPAGEAVIGEHLAGHHGHPSHVGPRYAGSRVEVYPQLVGVVGVVGAN